jgi:O-antigen/teichoic acid export membrane protein
VTAATPGDAAATETSVARDAGWLLTGRAITAVAQWSATALIARTLAPDDWGGYSFVFGLFGILGLIVDLQVSRIVLRQVIDAEAQGGDDGRAAAARVVGSYTTLRLLIGVTAMLLGIVVVLVGGYSAEICWATVIVGASLVLMSPGWGLHLWFQARLNLRPVAIANIVAAIAQLAAVLAIVQAFEPSLVLFALPALVTQGVILLGLAVALLRRGLWPRFAWMPREWGAWIREAAPLAIGFGLVSIYLKLDLVLLSQLDTMEAVGLYGIGYKFSDLATFVPLAFLTPVLTVMVSVPDGSTRELGRHFRQAFVLLFVAATGLATAFALTAEPLISLLYGEQYTVGANAARLLVSGASIGFLTHLCVTTLVACRRNSLYAIAGLVGLVLNVTLNVALIPRYSFRGSAFATIVTEVAVLALLLWALARTPEVVVLPIGAIVRTVLAGIAMAAVYLAVVLVAPWWIAVVAAGFAFAAALHVTGVDGPGGLRALAANVRFRSEPELLREEGQPQPIA